MATLNLTRKQYDFLIDMNQPLLQRAVDECTGKRWSLSGVAYEGLDWGLVEQIEEAVGMGDTEEGAEFPRGEFGHGFCAFDDDAEQVRI